MVTAYGDEQLATRVLRAGALDYVVKDPSDNFLAELPKRVGESVTRHRLQQTNRLLIEALESARDGIMITDLQGTMLHVNQALERMTGYTRAEMLGQNPRLLKSDRHPPQIYEEMWRTVLARASWQGELTNRRKDGGLVEVSLTVSPILDGHGQLTHFVGIQRDITDRKLLERQLLQAQKMQSVGTLAGGVAHEFNNLLAGINGYAALALREPSLPESARLFLNHIVDLSDRAAVLTRQMLAYARKPTLVRQPMRIDHLVRATAELVTHTLNAEVVLEAQLPAGEDGPLLVQADANQLQQALVNLALNARDALIERAPIVFRLRRVMLTGERAAFPEMVPPGDYVVLEVGDRGCGMSPEVLSQALDPFFTTKGVGQGTGLGLPVVLGIVHGHQGYLTIDTEAGRGTCVSLYLPRFVEESRPEGEGIGFPEGEILEPESVPGRNILVLDEEEAVLDVIRRFLEIAGHHVTCTTSAEEAAMRLADGQAIDLLIFDLRLHGEDGIKTLQRFREKRPQLPILLCTGLIDADSAPALTPAGPVRMLRKPFRMNELWYAVNEALAPG
jgi:PAS domain S-box-containing protein